MIRETKTITMGSSYDFINLDKYTSDKESIKVTFESTGEKLTDWVLSDTGALIIQNGVIDYKSYENAHDIKMIIEYTPSGLPLGLQDIDTVEGLTKHITDLKSLEYIRKIRSAAHNKFDITLHEFVVFNTVLFDQFGQCMKISYDKQDSCNRMFHGIMALEDFRTEIDSYSYGSGAIALDHDICPHCKQKWTLIDFGKCVRQGEDIYHVECNKYSLYDKVKTEFEYIASNIFSNYTIHAIKNEYGSEEYNGPWFIISTSEGDIKIGWRKRVIEINWLENFKPFKFDGEGEEVTKHFNDKVRYIHAYSDSKAIEYLRKSNRGY